MDQNLLQIPSPRKEYIIHERFVFAIAIHRRALKSVYIQYPRKKCFFDHLN